jgi:predicted kinase
MAPATAALEPLEAVNVLVCGPPCAGKTTWVARNAPPSATIVCYDTIAAELGHRGPGRPPFKLGRAAEAQVQQALRRIERGEITNAYVIRTMAGPQRRAELATRIRARIVLLLPDMDELMRRASQRHDPTTTARDIARWMTQEASGEVRAQSARPPEVPARDAQGGLWVL